MDRQAGSISPACGSSPGSSALAATTALPIGGLTAVIYINGARAVDRGLELGAPDGIGTGTTPNLVSADASFSQRLPKRHALIEQLNQGRTSVRRELLFSLLTISLSLKRCPSGPAVCTVAASIHS